MQICTLVRRFILIFLDNGSSWKNDLDEKSCEVKVKFEGQDCRRRNVGKVVGATPSDGFLVICLITYLYIPVPIYAGLQVRQVSRCAARCPWPPPRWRASPASATSSPSGEDRVGSASLSCTQDEQRTPFRVY